MTNPRIILTNQSKADKGDFTENLEDLLASDKPKARVFGRMVAAGISDRVVEWLDAERRRGTSPGMLIEALIILQVQQVAALSANVATAAGTDAALSLYREILDHEFVLHANRTRQMLAQAQRKAATPKTGHPPPSSV